jgi:CpeT protein
MTTAVFHWTTVAMLGSVAAGCASQSPNSGEASPGLDTLASWMSGSFSSAEQAAEDPENYRDVRLHMTPIWTDRADGPWLYVEQAMAATLEKPYRQRVYRLSKGKTTGEFESAVFELPGDPLVFAGAWREPELVAGVTPRDLSEKKGCSIILQFQEGAFRGSTIGTECLSTLRGAAYATSEVTIESDRLISWDRGFDAEGWQVWGTDKGGYIFVKE